MDIDSSDLELGSKPTSRYVNAGKRSVASMLERAVEDRFESKKAAIHLALTNKSPNVEYHLELWHARLTAYRANTLRVKDVHAMAPTGKDIERFVSSIINHLQSHKGMPVSLGTVKVGVASIIKASAFYFADFKITNHDTARLASRLESLVLEGKVTRQKKFDRQWIGAFMLGKMVRAVYTRSLEEGVCNWDVALAKIQNMVLVAALGCRVGDITKGQRDRHDLPYLCYGDIEMKLNGGEDVDDLVMVVLLRNNKGCKDNPDEDSTKYLECITKPGSLALCPLKIILVMALRTGNVHATTIEELLAHTTARLDRTVQWKDRRLPICPAFKAHGAKLQLTVPAPSKQLGGILADAALLVGIYVHVRPHAIRRGAAKDTRTLARQGKGANGTVMPVVQDVLMHSYESLQRGVTRAYTGTAQDDDWVPRVSANMEHTFDTPRMLAPHEERFQKKKQHTSAEVDAFCAKYNLDPTARKDRLQATRLAHKGALAEWREGKADATKPANRSRTATGGVEDVAAAASIEANSNEDDDDDDDDDDDVPVDDIAERDAVQVGHRLSALLLDDGGNKTQSEEEDYAMIDSAIVSNIIFDQIDAGEINDSPVANPQVPGTLDLARITSLEFVKMFSKINTTNSTTIAASPSKKRGELLAALDGNSRDPASVMVYVCRNRNVNGCTHTSTRRHHMQKHEDLCQSSIKKIVKTLYCPEPHCAKAFANESALKQHKVRTHEWEPAPCPYGCEPTKLHSFSAYAKHVRGHHVFAASKCPVGHPECTSNRVFKSRHVLEGHFEKSHPDMDASDRDRLIASAQQGVDHSVPAPASKASEKGFKTPAIIVDSDGSDE